MYCEFKDDTSNLRPPFSNSHTVLSHFSRHFFLRSLRSFQSSICLIIIIIIILLLLLLRFSFRRFRTLFPLMCLRQVRLERLIWCLLATRTSDFLPLQRSQELIPHPRSLLPPSRIPSTHSLIRSIASTQGLMPSST